MRPVFLHFLAEAHAHSDGDAPGHHAVGAEIVVVDVGDVHRAAPAPAVAGLLAHEFGHHQVHVGVFGYAMAVPAMGGEDVIFGVESGDSAHSRGFHADREVHGAVDFAQHVQLLGLFLEGPDLVHLAEPVVFGFSGWIHYHLHPVEPGSMCFFGGSCGNG